MRAREVTDRAKVFSALPLRLNSITVLQFFKLNSVEGVDFVAGIWRETSRPRMVSLKMGFDLIVEIALFRI